MGTFQERQKARLDALEACKTDYMVMEAILIVTLTFLCILSLFGLAIN